MRFVLDRRALEQIAKSPAAQAEVMRRAEKVGAAAGPGFEVSGRVGQKRARASVRADSFSARVRNSRENILLRALQAGRNG